MRERGEKFFLKMRKYPDVKKQTLNERLRTFD